MNRLIIDFNWDMVRDLIGSRFKKGDRFVIGGRFNANYSRNWYLGLKEVKEERIFDRLEGDIIYDSKKCKIGIWNFYCHVDGDFNGIIDRKDRLINPVCWLLWDDRLERMASMLGRRSQDEELIREANSIVDTSNWKTLSYAVSLIDYELVNYFNTSLDYLK